MSSMKEFKEIRAEIMDKMDEARVEDRRIPLIARLQKRAIAIDKAIENLLLLSGDKEDLSAKIAAAKRLLESIEDSIMIDIEKLARKETADEAKRSILVKCEVCGTDNYLSRKEYISAFTRPCRNCGLPL